MYHSSQIKIGLVFIFIVLCSYIFLETQNNQQKDVIPVSQPTLVVPPSDPYLIKAETMSLEDKIRQILICGYSGTDIKDALSKSKLCGNFIIFEQNLVELSESQIITNHSKLNSNDNLVWIMIDQEGGKVSRIEDGIPSAYVIGEASSAALLGQYHGLLLHKLLIDINLAPVADIASQSSVIGTRSFGNDPQTASQSVIEYVHALQSNQVISVVKHLPGQGQVDIDTHKDTGTLEKSWDEIKDFELIPFVNAVNSGAEIFMIGHFNIPSVDTKPASISKKVISELRHFLPKGQELIFITDSLSMSGVGLPPSEAAIESLLAGEDMLLIPGISEGTIFEKIFEAYNTNILDTKLLDLSVAKILRIKSRFGKHSLP